MLQMLKQDRVRSPPLPPPQKKSHSDRDITADLFLSGSPILYNIQHMPIWHAIKL